MFCLAVCYLLKYFTEEPLVRLSYVLFIPCYLQQQHMTNNVMTHMQETQTLLLISMLNAYILHFQKLNVYWKQILEVPAASVSGRKSTLHGNKQLSGYREDIHGSLMTMVFPLSPYTLRSYLVPICCITEYSKYSSPHHKNLYNNLLLPYSTQENSSCVINHVLQVAHTCFETF